MNSVNSSVRDIAVLSPLAVSVLEKHGIDYCCGGLRPFNEVCDEKGIKPEALLEEIDSLNRSAADSSEMDWNSSPLPELVQHIVDVHHQYARRELPMLEQRMATVLRVHGKTNGEVLQPLSDIFTALKTEFELHMKKEEMVLFPSIERVVKNQLPAKIGRPHFEDPIRMMEHEHDSAGAAFAEMRRLTDNFTPPDYACTTFRALYAGLEAFERDTHQHVHLENNILFPRTLELDTKSA